MDRLHGLEEKLSRLRSLSQVVDKKVADAKELEANIDSRRGEFLQLQLQELRQRTLLRILLQLESRLQSQRQKLNALARTVDRRK